MMKQPIQAEKNTLNALYQAWNDHHRASHKSERTLTSYHERLFPFIQWCRLRGVEYAPQVSLALLESYQRYLRSYRKADGQPLAIGGQLARLSAIRMWFHWLLKNHHILYNPAELITLPKEQRRLPTQVLSEEETRNLMDSQTVLTPLGLRNRVILEVFWSSGIRRMELANLRENDVNFSRGTLAIRQGKGNKDRVVPIGESALDWIRRYLNEVRPQLSARCDSGHLFLTIRGKAISPATLTQLAARAIRQQANIDKPGACHLLRHSMATQMLENGADTRYIQAILGHEKLETTQIYTKVAIAPLKAVHEKTHPGNQIKVKNADNSALIGNDEVAGE